MLTFNVSVRAVEEAGFPATITFDATLAALAELKRMFIEPDGSFVWTGVSADGQKWQVDGNLIDRGDRLAYVELKGYCPEAELDRALKCAGWPDVSLVFELQRRGVVVGEPEFRRLAASQTGAV